MIESAQFPANHHQIVAWHRRFLPPIERQSSFHHRLVRLRDTLLEFPSCFHPPSFSHCCFFHHSDGDCVIHCSLHPCQVTKWYCPISTAIRNGLFVLSGMDRICIGIRLFLGNTGQCIGTIQYYWNNAGIH